MNSFHAVCVSFCLLLCFSSLSFSQEPESSSVGPLSPEEAKKAFELHPDCKIELVACEPDVIDPVHIDFNIDGKLWVVEMSDYPNGPEDSQPGLSRIRVLSDGDGDGRYSNPVTFAEKLLFANGLMFWRDGVIVTTDGKIQFMRDTDGDGKSDETQIWFQGFATENPQLRHNHPQLAMDCKIYVANGLRGGDIVPGPDNPWGLDPNAKPLSISGRDFRFDPLTGEYEAIAGQGQFGMTFDRYGNRFVCTNRNPCRHIVLEDEQLKQTPGLRISRHYEDVAPAGEDSKLYPISKTWTTSNLHANQFTAACGVLIYQDASLFGDSRGSCFTCDPTANLVHREVLVPDGPTFDSIDLEDEAKRKEFLATKDNWFRPVNLTHGPDGALYIVDMYRAVIEHPQFMPAELKERPDLALGTDRGRIWKIQGRHHSYSNRGMSVTVQNPVKVNPSDKQRLFSQLLQSPFSISTGFAPYWSSSHAHRLCLESMDDSILEMVRSRENYTGVMLSLLDQCDELTLDHVVVALNPKSQVQFSRRVNAQIVIQIGSRRFGTDAKWIAAIHELIDDRLKRLNTSQQNSTSQPSKDLDNEYAIRKYIRGPVISEFYSVLEHVPWNELKMEQRKAVLKELLLDVKNEKNRYWLSTFLCLSGYSKSLKLLDDLLRTADDVESKYLPLVARDIAEFCARQNQSREVQSLLQEVLNNHSLDAKVKLGVVAGLVDGTPGGRQSLLQQVERLDEAARLHVKDLIDFAAVTLGDSQNIPSMTSIVLTVVSLSDDDKTLNQLLTATGSGDTDFASLALSALLNRPAEQVNPALLEILPQRRGRIRREILQAMAGNASRVALLLDEIEAGRVAKLEIDSTVERMLLRHKDKALVARAKKLIKREPPADRVNVLAEYQSCLTMESDPLRGRVVFEKNCATCHKIGDLGVNVAPDISDSRTKQPDYYLTSIIDPNRAIDANYFSYTIADTQGRVHTGIVDAETGASITLKQPEGKRVTIARDEIEQVKNNGVSLMPVGLERTINKQQMADLISFIKNWRYLDGSVPDEVIR